MHREIGPLGRADKVIAKDNVCCTAYVASWHFSDIARCLT